MFELVRDELQEIANKKGITKNKLKKIIRENSKKDPHKIALKKHRYLIEPSNTIYDTQTKKYHYFKSDKKFYEFIKNNDCITNY